jgi:hypothetical protein
MFCSRESHDSSLDMAAIPRRRAPAGRPTTLEEAVHHGGDGAVGKAGGEFSSSRRSRGTALGAGTPRGSAFPCS